MKVIKRLIACIAFMAFTWAVYLCPLLFRGDQSQCLPPHMRNKVHADILWGLVPVAWKTISYCEDHAPEQLIGNQKIYSRALNGEFGIRPIPNQEEFSFFKIRFDTKPWNVVTFGFVKTFPKWFHIRVDQCRWDDLDHYHTCPSVKFQFVNPPLDELYWHWQLYALQDHNPNKRT